MSRVLPVLGLKNLGNTCFLNSVLQSLVVVPPFVEYLKTCVSVFKKKNFSQASICYELMTCLEALRPRPGYNRRNFSTVINPINLYLELLKKEPSLFENGDQQDAHELLGKLLALVQDEVCAAAACENDTSWMEYSPSANDLKNERKQVRTATNGIHHSINQDCESSISLSERKILAGGAQDQTPLVAFSRPSKLGFPDSKLDFYHTKLAQDSKLEIKNTTTLASLAKDAALPFHGLLEDCWSCKHCQQLKPVKSCGFWDLSLTLPTGPITLPRRSVNSLEACLLERFSREEVLHVICEMCTATKKMQPFLLDFYQPQTESNLQLKQEANKQISGTPSPGTVHPVMCHDLLLKKDILLVFPDLQFRHFEEETEREGVHQRFYHEQKIRLLPPVLCVHLQRRISSSQVFDFFGNRPGKHVGHITFPEQLDISKYQFIAKSCKALDCQYDLRAVIVHYGNGSSGHYETYTRELCDDGSVTHQWYHVSDERVRLVDQTEVFRSEAYMLFYNRTPHTRVLV